MFFVQRTWVRLLPLFLIPSLVSISPSVLAQSSSDDNASEGLLISSVTTTGLVITAVSPFLTTTFVASSSKRAEHWERYIRNNAVALHRDISLGGGEITEDLAQIFGISEEKTARFGRLLRQQRDTLLPLTDVETLTPERALEFARTIFQTLENNVSFEAEAARLKPHFEPA